MVMKISFNLFNKQLHTFQHKCYYMARLPEKKISKIIMSDLPNSNQPNTPFSPPLPPQPNPIPAPAPPQPNTMPSPTLPVSSQPSPVPNPAVPPTPSQAAPSQPPTPPSSPPPNPPQENTNITPSAASPSDIKKSKLKPILLIIFVLVLFAAIGFVAYRFLFSSNSNTGTTSPTTQQTAKKQTTTIEYWGLWEPSTVMTAILSEFEAQNPNVTVNYTQQSPKDYRERLQSALASGSGPDIFRYHNTWVPMLTKDLDTLPSTVMSASEFQSTFYPVASSDLKVSNSYVGIPLMIDGLALYYNEDVFNTAGKSVPSSWDELRDTATELTVKSGNNIERSGIALGTTGNVDHYSDILGLMLLQNGADPANPTDSLAQDALTFYTLFASTDKIWNQTLPNSTTAFATEKAAMMIGPSWRAHEIKDINPSLNFKTAPLPQLPGEEVTWATYWVEGVSAQSQSKAQAWELLKFLSTQENLEKLYAQASQERLFGEPYSRIDMANELIADPIVGAYIEQAPLARSWPMASSTFDNGLNDGIIKYYEDAINGTNSGTAPSAALETASKGIVQILSRYATSAQ